jgi:hypothetical protein
LRVALDANHLITHLGKAGRRHQAHISRSYHAYLHRSTLQAFAAIATNRRGSDVTARRNNDDKRRLLALARGHLPLGRNAAQQRWKQTD